MFAPHDPIRKDSRGKKKKIKKKAKAKFIKRHLLNFSCPQKGDSVTAVQLAP